jgi:hypothetical protein
VTDHEVEQRLGYTPCVCGMIDGTWHPGCYRGKTDTEIRAGYKRAFANARKHLKQQAQAATAQVLQSFAKRAEPGDKP